MGSVPSSVLFPGRSYTWLAISSVYVCCQPWIRLCSTIISRSSWIIRPSCKILDLQPKIAIFFHFLFKIRGNSNLLRCLPVLHRLQSLLEFARLKTNSSLTVSFPCQLSQSKRIHRSRQSIDEKPTPLPLGRCSRSNSVIRMRFYSTQSC